MSCTYIFDSSHQLDPLPSKPSLGSIIHELDRTISSLKVEENLLQDMSPDLHDALRWRARSAPTYVVEAELIHILDPIRASRYPIPKRRTRTLRPKGNEALFVRGYVYGTFRDGTRRRVANTSDLEDGNDWASYEESSRRRSLMPPPLQLDPDEVSFSVHATNEALHRMLVTRDHLGKKRSEPGKENDCPVGSILRDPQPQSAPLRNLRSQELLLARSLRWFGLNPFDTT